jgi:hypothetical protein
MRKAPFRTLLHNTNIARAKPSILHDSRIVLAIFPHSLYIHLNNDNLFQNEGGKRPAKPEVSQGLLRINSVTFCSNRLYGAS